MARAAYRVLYQQGYHNTAILDEGIPGWRAKHYPTAGSGEKG